MPFAFVWGALALHSLILSSPSFLAASSVRLVSTLALAWKAVRRRPYSVASTALVLTSSASLLGVAVPTALLLWALASVVGLATWLALEPFALKQLGCRPPSRLERERLDSSVVSAGGVEVLVLDAAQPWLKEAIEAELDRLHQAGMPTRPCCRSTTPRGMPPTSSAS